MENKKRPKGLFVLAVINFIFALVVLLAGLLLFLSPQLLEQGGITITPYTILSPILTGALLIISGIILGKGLLIHIPSMIYPIVLLLLLNLQYKKYFAETK